MLIFCYHAQQMVPYSNQSVNQEVMELMREKLQIERDYSASTSIPKVVVKGLGPVSGQDRLKEKAEREPSDEEPLPLLPQDPEKRLGRDVRTMILNKARK
jgi:hypothetical protein